MSTPAAKRIIVVCLVLLLLILLPTKIYPTLVLDVLLWGVFAMSIDLMLGYGGLLSFGQAAFWGAGGYTAALLATRFHLVFPAAVLGALIFGLALAVPIGYLSIRTKGIYFAMVTLAFAEMVYYWANEWRDVTRGENGIQGVPRILPGLDLNNPLLFYYACLPIVFICVAIAFRTVHSPFGHVLVAIRENEARAQALGYATARYKLLAFVISSGLASIAGGMSALAHGTADLTIVDWTTSGEAVIMTILGGIGTLWGSMLGSAVVLLLQDWLSTSGKLTDATGVVTGALFMAIVLGLRRGIWGTAALWLQRRGGEPEPEPLAQAIGAPPPAGVVSSPPTAVGEVR
ncbi:MAG TPA: branched-chain amino acid ABC transporter permease [Chloroflexota bacterium]